MVERGHVVAQHVVDDLVNHWWWRGYEWGVEVLEEITRVVDVDRLSLAVNDVRVIGLKHTLPVRDGLTERHLVVLHEVAQLRLALGGVEFKGVIYGVVDTVPVHARGELAEGEVDVALGVGSTRRSLLSQLGPVLREQVLCAVRGLALEVVDELGGLGRVNVTLWLN